jgi:HSP90 family molecular chaperone
VVTLPASSAPNSTITLHLKTILDYLNAWAQGVINKYSDHISLPSGKKEEWKRRKRPAGEMQATGEWKPSIRQPPCGH